jgi:uncharacterized protein
MSNKFITDPHEVVKAGEVVRVKVLEVDIARKRIALTMRLEDTATRKPDPTKPRSNEPNRNSSRTQQTASYRQEPQNNGLMAEALAQALKKRGS